MYLQLQNVFLEKKMKLNTFTLNSYLKFFTFTMSKVNKYTRVKIVKE